MESPIVESTYAIAIDQNPCCPLRNPMDMIRQAESRACSHPSQHGRRIVPVGFKRRVESQFGPRMKLPDVPRPD